MRKIKLLVELSSIYLLLASRVMAASGTTISAFPNTNALHQTDLILLAATNTAFQAAGTNKNIKISDFASSMATMPGLNQYFQFGNSTLSNISAATPVSLPGIQLSNTFGAQLSLLYSSLFGYQTNGFTTNTPTGLTNAAYTLAAKVANGQATNDSARGAYGFSINLLNTINLQKAFNNYTTHKPRILYLGDSTGYDSIAAVYAFFASNYVYGVEDIVQNGGVPSAYFDLNPGCPGVGQINSAVGGDSHWWGTVMSLTNSFNQTFGIRNFVAAKADKLKFWWIAGANYGSLAVFTSPSSASNTWTLRATVDTTLGTAGLHCTNLSLTLDNYYVKISNSVAGTQSRSLYLIPTLENSASNNVGIFDASVGGAIVNDFLTMGNYSIATLITNYQPDAIVWQQTKQVASYDSFTNSIFKTFQTNYDMILIQSQESSDPTISSDPVNGGQFQLAVAREIARSNAWVYVDNKTPFTDWPNVVTPFQLTNGGSGGIHFGTVGRQVSGQMTIRQLGLLGILANSGTLLPASVNLTAYAKLVGGNNWGGAQVFSNNSITVTGQVVAAGSAASVDVVRQTAGDTVRQMFTGSGGSAKYSFSLGSDNYAHPILSFTIPFGGAGAFEQDPAWGAAPTLGAAWPWQVYSVNTTLTGGSTNKTALTYSNSWLTALATRKTNLGQKAIWEVDVKFVDTATGTPTLQVVIEQMGPSGALTNTWRCSQAGGLASTVTNHYCFTLGTNAVVTCTDVSPGTAASVALDANTLFWQ